MMDFCILIATESLKNNRTSHSIHTVYLFSVIKTLQECLPFHLWSAVCQRKVFFSHVCHYFGSFSSTCSKYKILVYWSRISSTKRLRDIWFRILLLDILFLFVAFKVDFFFYHPLWLITDKKYSPTTHL